MSDSNHGHHNHSGRISDLYSTPLYQNYSNNLQRNQTPSYEGTYGWGAVVSSPSVPTTLKNRFGSNSRTSNYGGTPFGGNYNGGSATPTLVLRNGKSIKKDIPQTFEYLAKTIQTVYNFWKKEIDTLSEFELKSITQSQYCYVFYNYPSCRKILKSMSVSNNNNNNNNGNNGVNYNSDDGGTVRSRSRSHSFKAIPSLGFRTPKYSSSNNGKHRRNSQQHFNVGSNHKDGSTYDIASLLLHCKMDYSAVLKYFDLLG